MTLEQHEMYVIAIILNSNNIAMSEAKAVIYEYVINTTQHGEYDIVKQFHNMTRAVYHINRSLHSKIYRCHGMDYCSMETYLS